MALLKHHTSSVAELCLTLQPYGLQQGRLPCPPPSPRVCSSSCPLNWRCYLTVSSSAAFSRHPVTQLIQVLLLFWEKPKFALMAFLLHLSPLGSLDLGLKISLLGLLQNVLLCFWELDRRENTWIKKNAIGSENQILLGPCFPDWSFCLIESELLIDWKINIGQWFFFPPNIYIYILLKYSCLTTFQVHSKVIQLYTYTNITFEIIFHYRLLLGLPWWLRW